MKKLWTFSTMFAFWIGLAVINTRYINADLEHHSDYLGDPKIRCGDYRSDLAFAVGWSILPPSWVVYPFITGFYQHGWRLRPRVECLTGE